MAEHRTSRLRDLADALNMPMDRFWTAVPEGDPGEDVMMLRLWSAIKDPQARARVLDCLRAEAERAGFQK